MSALVQGARQRARVMEEMGVKEALALAPAALSGSDYLDKGGMFFAHARMVRVSTKPPGLEFTVDREVIGDEPAEFAVVPRALKVRVGPEYRMRYGESA